MYFREHNKKLLSEKDEISMIFAVALSQNEMPEKFINILGIEWQKINAFHMEVFDIIGGWSK